MKGPKCLHLKNRRAIENHLTQIKDDYAFNSYYLTHTFLFKGWENVFFFNLGVICVCAVAEQAQRASDGDASAVRFLTLKVPAALHREHQIDPLAFLGRNRGIVTATGEGKELNTHLNLYVTYNVQMFVWLLILSTKEKQMHIFCPQTSKNNSASILAE